MKQIIIRLASSLAVLAITTAPLMALSTEAENAELITKLKKNYPLETCVVSGDKLVAGEMGPPVDYLYEEQGKEPRLVRFCCKSCIKTFKKTPAKYLNLIDEAAAKTKAGDSAASCCSGAPNHEGHQQH